MTFRRREVDARALYAIQAYEMRVRPAETKSELEVGLHKAFGARKDVVYEDLCNCPGGNGQKPRRDSYWR